MDVIVQSLSRVQRFATHELQHARLPCPSLSPRVCSNSCPLSWLYHPTISSSVEPSIFPSTGDFSKELAVCIRWRKYWNFSFSISPSSEFSGLISFRIDQLDFLVVSSTTIRKHQFFGTQPSLWFNSHIYTWCWPFGRRSLFPTAWISLQSYCLPQSN